MLHAWVFVAAAAEVAVPDAADPTRRRELLVLALDVTVPFFDPVAELLLIEELDALVARRIVVV